MSSTSIKDKDLLKEIEKMSQFMGLTVEEYVVRSLKSTMLLDTIADSHDRLEIKGPDGGMYFSTSVNNFFDIK